MIAKSLNIDSNAKDQRSTVGAPNLSTIEFIPYRTLPFFVFVNLSVFVKNAILTVKIQFFQLNNTISANRSA
jgi:hypothetical protein